MQEEPIAKVDCTIGRRKEYFDRKHIFYVSAIVDDQAVAKLMNYLKLADPNDTSHGELSDRVHLLKCEKEGKDPMCKVTPSFVDERKSVCAVEILRNVYHLGNEKNIEIKNNTN